MSVELQEPDSLCLLARALFLHTDVNLSTVDPSPSRRRWELRKGWDLLLDGYWREFESSGSEGQWPVVLKLKTYLPSWEAGPSDLNTWVVARAKKNYGKSREQLPAVVFITEDLSREALRDAYAEADAFVLPTRGEGWGLPIAEAMAMELPVIVSLKLVTSPKHAIVSLCVSFCCCFRPPTGQGLPLSCRLKTLLHFLSHITYQEGRRSRQWQ